MTQHDTLKLSDDGLPSYQELLEAVYIYQQRTGQTLEDTLAGKWTAPPAPEGMRSAEEILADVFKEFSPLSDKDELGLTYKGFIELIKDIQQNTIASQSEKLRKMREAIQRMNDKRMDTTGSEPPMTLVETFWLNQLAALSDGE